MPKPISLSRAFATSTAGLIGGWIAGASLAQGNIVNAEAADSLRISCYRAQSGGVGSSVLIVDQVSGPVFTGRTNGQIIEFIEMSGTSILSFDGDVSYPAKIRVWWLEEVPGFSREMPPFSIEMAARVAAEETEYEINGTIDHEDPHFSFPPSATSGLIADFAVMTSDLDSAFFDLSGAGNNSHLLGGQYTCLPPYVVSQP